MNLQRFLHDFQPLLTEFSRGAFRDFQFPFEVTPHSYLAEAEESLSRLTLGGNREAVSNAKRAIDCQVEAVLKTLGLRANGGFPSRLSSIRKIGLVAPRILEKINKLRNSIEHDFTNPTREQAELAVDTALLFVELTHRVFRQTIFQCAIYDPTPKLKTWVNWGPNYVVFEMIGEAERFDISGEIKGKVSFKQVVTRDDPEYIPLIRFFLAGDFAYSDISDEDLVNNLRTDIAF
ncbi:hypothetical protein [Pseudomonas sp. S2_H01]